MALIIGNIIGIPAYSIGGITLPSCVQDIAISWYQDLDNTISSTVQIDGLLDFDGIDDIVTLSSHPDVTGDKIISFNLFLKTDTFTTNSSIFSFGNTSTDHLTIIAEGSTLRFHTSSSVAANYNVYIDITGLDNTTLNIIVDKSTQLINSITINGESKSLTTTISLNADSTSYIGRSIDGFGNNFLIWDINIDDTTIYTGYPSGNLDIAWEDQLGSIDGTVSGNPTVTSIDKEISIVKDQQGTETRDIQYGQYLTNSSGQINFYRTEGTFDYTDPSDGTITENVPVPPTGLYSVPTDGICNIGVLPIVGGYYPEVLDFDGANSCVILDSHPDISNVKTISFTCYLPTTGDDISLNFYDSNTDYLAVLIDSSGFSAIGHSNTGFVVLPVSPIETVLNVVIVKGYQTITSVTINGVLQTLTSYGGQFNVGEMSDVINGNYDGVDYTGLNGLIWDVNINDEHLYYGRPDGNLDTAWEDQIGSIDGTIQGTPSTTTIGTLSTAEYTAFYPCIEGAGTVLHDTMEGSIHISVATPDWDETLYGSDYLNQTGYVTKTQSDALGYDWETTVNGSPVTLNDDTLIPLKQ